MAENQGVWGIDIGQAGLKAIRLRYAEAAKQAIAVAFDYVPHPKILSQPDAVPEELIAQALQTFLSRNDLKNDRVAISVPGQTALARFIQLPPVEAGKVAEIVKYEARQQIPFALEDVIWDFQTLGGGVEESGFMLDAEVGLFAMKRDQVLGHLKPFMDAKVEVELIQVAPLALYNFLCYDRLGIRLGEAAEPAEGHTIVVDMGADSTTLMVSNGEKIWIRNVHIGGNHFTRALTKEMKLTFAKAEHLKCNATKSPDPRAVFQALRPVFNEYVAEIQRSIGYFSSVNREAKITKILGLGNGFKLAGLQKFLQQNLQYEVERVENFPGLVGDSVLGAPLFQENLLSFGVPYGLALQTMGLTRVHTTLLPPEIATARKIRKKKPWAVVTAATLLFGLGTSAMGFGNVWHSVSEERFGTVEKAAESLDGKISSAKSAYSSAEGENKKLKESGELLVKNVETRDYWLEIYKAISSCLPRETGDQLDETDPRKKNRVKLLSVTSKYHEDLGEWFSKLPPYHKQYMRPVDLQEQPTGAGYVFTLQCVHYHHDNEDPLRTGINYANHQFLKKLQSWAVTPPGSSGAAVPVRQIGITHPTIRDWHTDEIPFYPNLKQRRGVPGGRMRPGGFAGAGEYYEGDEDYNVGLGPALGGLPGGRPPRGLKNIPLPGTDEEDDENKSEEIPRTTFTIEFVWKETPHDERLDKEPVVEIDEAKVEEAKKAPAATGGGTAGFEDEA
jgi:type IV pilus assembly protein PilM